MTELKLILALPPDSHPSVINGRHIERDEGLLGTARGAMQTMYDVYGNVNALATTVRDKAKLAREALPHIERAASRVGKAIEQLRARRVQLDKQLVDKVEGDGRDHIGGELRAFLQRLPKGQAPLKVADAARLGDRRTVAAALSAPAFLSGLTPEQQQILRGVARTALEPDSTGLLADLDANIDRVQRAHEVFLTKTAAHIREWRDGDDDLIAKRLGRAS